MWNLTAMRPGGYLHPSSQRVDIILQVLKQQLFLTDSQQDKKTTWLCKTKTLADKFFEYFPNISLHFHRVKTIQWWGGYLSTSLSPPTSLSLPLCVSLNKLYNSVLNSANCTSNSILQLCIQNILNSNN